MDPLIPEIEEVPSILLPCSSCTRTFRPEALAKHTKVCEKSLMKKRKTFDSSKQRLQGTEVESFSPGAGTGSLRKARGKERQEPVKVVQAGKERVGQTQAGKRTDLQSKVRPSDHTECPYCGRSFGPKSFERHAEFCKEQQLKLKSNPSNPEAKERLKVRTSYKGPLTHKVLTRDKYQPKRDPSPINIELRDVGSIGKGLRRNSSLRSSLRNSRGSHSISPPPLRRTMTQISPSTEARKPKKESVSESTRLTNGNRNQGVPRMVNKDPPDRKVKDRNLNNSVTFPKIPVFDKEANNNNIKYSEKHCRKREKEWQTFGFGNVKDFKEVKNNFSSRPLSSTKNYITVSEMETSASEEVSSPGYMEPYRPRKLLASPQYLKRSKTIKLIERCEKKLLFTPNCQSEDSKEFSGPTENGENCLLLPNIVCIPNTSEDILCTTSDNYNSITQNSEISQLMTKLTENIENQLSSSKDLSFYKAIDINLLVCPMELSSNALDNNKQQNVGKKCDSQIKLENNVIPNSSNGESLKCNSDDHSQNIDLNLHDGLEVIQTQTSVLDKYSNIKINEPVVNIHNSKRPKHEIEPRDLVPKTNFLPLDVKTKFNAYKQGNDTHSDSIDLKKNICFQLPKCQNIMDNKYSNNKKNIMKSYKLDSIQTSPFIHSDGSISMSNKMEGHEFYPMCINRKENIADSQLCTADLSLADLEFLENKFISPSLKEKNKSEESKQYPKSTHYDPLQISSLIPGNINPQTCICVPDIGVINQEFFKNGYYSPLNQDSSICNLSSTPEYTSKQTIASEVMKEPITCKTLPIQNQSTISAKDNNYCNLQKTNTLDIPIIPFNHHWTSSNTCENKQNLEKEALHIKNAEKNIVHKGNNLSFTKDSLVNQNSYNIFCDRINLKSILNQMECSRKRKKDVSKENHCSNSNNIFYTEDTENLRKIKKRSTYFMRTHYDNEHEKYKENKLNAPLQTESCAGISIDKLGGLNNQSEKNLVLPSRNDLSFMPNYIENASKVVPHQKQNLTPLTDCLPEIMKQKKKYNFGKKENNLIGSSQSICYGVSSATESNESCLCLQRKIINKSNIMKIYPLLEILTINTGKADILGNTIDVMFSNTEKPKELEQIILNETCCAEELPRKSGEYEVTSPEVQVMTVSELNTNANELGSELSTKCGELDNFETHTTLTPSEISTKCNEFVSSETHSMVKTSEINTKCEELCYSESHSTVTPSKISSNSYEIVNSETHPALTPEIRSKCEELGNSEIFPTVTPFGVSTNCKESVYPEVLMEYKEFYNSECSSEMLINCSDMFFPADHFSTEIYKIDAFCKESRYPEVHTSDNASENVEVTLDQWTAPNGIIEKNTIHYSGCHSSTDSHALMDNEHTNIHSALLKSPVHSVEESSKLIDPLSLDLGYNSNMTLSVPIVENHNQFACDNLMKYSPIHRSAADEFMVCNENKLNACSNQYISNKNCTNSDEWYITKSSVNTGVPSSPLGCSNLVQQDPNDLDTISEDSLECGSLDPFYGCEYLPSDSDSVFSDSLKELSCESPILFWNDRKLCNPKMSYNKDLSNLDGDYFSHQSYMFEGIEDTQKVKGKMKVDHCRAKENTNFHSHYSSKKITEISHKNNRISEKSNCIFPLAVSKEISKTAKKLSVENKYSRKNNFEGIFYNNSKGIEENFSVMGVRGCNSDTETATCVSDIETNSAAYVKQCSKVVEYFQEGKDYHTVETSIYKFPKFEDNLGKAKYVSPKSPARYTSLPSQFSLTQNKDTSNVEGNLLKLPLIKKSQPSSACCNSLPQRNESLPNFSPLVPAKRCKSYKMYQSSSNPQYSDILFRGDEKVDEQNRIFSSLYPNSVKDFDGTKTVDMLADDKLSYKKSSCLNHSSFENIKNILPAHELLNEDQKFSYYENCRKSDPIKVDNLRSQFSHSARRTSSALEAPVSTSIQFSRDKNYPKIPQRQLSMSIFPSIHPKECIGEGENYNPYLSAERQMMELFGGEGKRSPGGVPSPLQSSPSSAFVKYRSSSSESLKEAEESLRAAEESLKEAEEWEEEEVESNRMRKPDPLGLSSLSLCSVVSIDSVDCNRNSEQGVVETKPRSGRVKVDMREMLYGGGEPPPPQADLQACEAELLLSMLEFEKMLKSSPLPSLQSSPTLCSSSPPDNDSNQNNNTTENHNNLKNLNQGSVDSAYSSLTRWSGGDGERNLPSFCHECGAKYPVSAAKFCCNCGIKRIALS